MAIFIVSLPLYYFQVAARTLGDLVRKLGERILPEIIPILENGLGNPDGDKRQGVCIGLSEIMNSASRDMISQFEDSLINTVRCALVDPLAEVRLAASQTFENLHNTIGHRALDGVLPDVFQKLVCISIMTMHSCSAHRCFIW